MRKISDLHIYFYKKCKKNQKGVNFTKNAKNLHKNAKKKSLKCEIFRKRAKKVENSCRYVDVKISKM